MKIKESILEQIKNDRGLRYKLQAKLEKSEGTIRKYIGSNDMLLTTVGSVNIIADHLKLNVSEILEDSE